MVHVEADTRRKLREEGRRDLAVSTFTRSETFFRSCQADNLKRIDLDTYFSLRSAISKQMYRLLDKRFYLRRVWTFDLREFANEHVGISRYAFAAKLKEKLRPALEELEALGFLKPMRPEGRYTRVRRGEWTITLARTPARVEPGDREAGPGPRPAEPGGLEKELIGRGVTRAVAAELAAARPAEAVAARPEVFDWLVERKDGRVSRNPAGYLADSIRKEYAAPEGFEGRAGRAAREAAEQERRRQEAEARRRRQAERARERALQAGVAKYWEGLSPEQQRALDAAALAGADAGLAETYRGMQAGGHPLASSFARLLREAHIARLLGLPAGDRG